MPTNSTNYSCNIKAVVNQSYGGHIKPLVIKSLRGGDTHNYADVTNKIILRIEAYTWFDIAKNFFAVYSRVSDVLFSHYKLAPSKLTH